MSSNGSREFLNGNRRSEIIDDRRGDCHKRIVIVCACLVLVLGALSIFFGVTGWQSQNLKNVDKLVELNLGMTAGSAYAPQAPLMALSVRKCLGLLAVFGMLVIVAALLGLRGISRGSQGKHLTACYDGTTMVLGLVTVLMGVHALGRQTTVAPILNRQVNDFCHPTTYIRLTENLGCSFAKMESPAPCNAACQDRVAMLRAIDACTVLPNLCDKFLYSEKSDDMVAPFYSQRNATGGLAACQAICNRDIVCNAFQYDVKDSACYIKSANATRYPANAWTEITSQEDANGLVEDVSVNPVQIKGDAYVLWTFKKYGYQLSVALLVLGFAELIAAVVTWMVLWDDNFGGRHPGRRARPTGVQVAIMTCSGCSPDNGEQQELIDNSSEDELR